MIQSSIRLVKVIQSWRKNNEKTIPAMETNHYNNFIYCIDLWMSNNVHLPEWLESTIHEIYQDDEASATRRINKAKMDMELAPLFQNVVKSEDADKTYQAVKDMILKELHKDA